ncbi:MAG: hypothetical protein WC792_05665 [Candidatus Micrarchaeia archaeon]|jgi:uncharacterized membrane protein YhaH (DUF805 family)
MKFFGTELNGLSAFQLSLVLMLVASVLASFGDALFFVAAVAAFNLGCAMLALRLSEDDRPGAFAMLVFFTVLSLGAGIGRSFLKSPQALALALPCVAVFFLAFFAIYKLFFLKDSAKAQVLGYSNGFAVVRVLAGFSHDVPRGVYAVASKPIAPGKARLLLKKKWLSASAIAGVAPVAAGGKKG